LNVHNIHGVLVGALNKNKRVANKQNFLKIRSGNEAENLNGNGWQSHTIRTELVDG
jgi:hypothetical protein